VPAAGTLRFAQHGNCRVTHFAFGFCPWTALSMVDGARAREHVVGQCIKPSENRLRQGGATLAQRFSAGKSVKHDQVR
jgi:hypothetical protein